MNFMTVIYVTADATGEPRTMQAYHDIKDDSI